MITRLAIRGFKSIGLGQDGKYAVDLELRPITILVGKNGSGKSSVLQGLGLLADIREGRGPSDGERVRVPSQGPPLARCNPMGVPSVSAPRGGRARGCGEPPATALSVRSPPARGE